MSTKTVFRVLALILGFLQAWAYRFYIEPDGVNYFDVAHAYLRRDWTSALNAYWSPLYSWLLALIQWIFRPSPYFESTSLHLLNFVLFVIALASFEFFFSRLLLLIRDLNPSPDSPGMPEWAWWTLGYTAFLVCTLHLITLGNDTPDMALAAFIFFATGFLIYLAQSDRSLLHYGSLGLILGFAYLAKSVMLPLSFVYIFAAAFARRGFRKPEWRVLATVAGFLLVSMPFGLALSHVKGRFTFGDTGKVAYFTQVMRMSLEQLASSNFPHRPQQLFDTPPVFIYLAPFSATYPAWYDSYWLEGVKPHFVWHDQLAAIARSFSGYFRIISTEKQWIAGWLALIFVAGDWRKTLGRILKLWFIWLPSAAALALYVLVLVEPRYVAAGLAILCVSLFGSVLGPPANMLRNVGVSVVLAVAATSGLALVKDGLTNLAICSTPKNHVQWQVAQGMLKMGFAPGDHVAVLGHTTVADYWAHLAGLQVTADIPLESMQEYWLATPENRQEIASRLQARGIKALVVVGPPLIPTAWHNIGDSGYYVQVLNPSPTTASTH